MKKYEIKSVGVWSLFKLHTIAGFVVSAVVYAINCIASDFLSNIGLNIGSITEALKLSSSFLSGLLACILYGIIAGVIALIAGLVYNLFAAAVGGVIVNLKDEL